MIKTYSLILLLIVHNVLGQKTSPKMTKLEKINKLITEEYNHILTIKRRGPKLEWRLLELESERLKLIKEQENQQFLNSSFTLRKKHPKEWFFQKSRNKEMEIRKKGHFILKKWPRFRYQANVYFTLALNSRDYNKARDTEKYFKKSIRNSSRFSRVHYEANVGLAEHYYNEKEYRKAIKHYNSVVKNTENEWLSKHYLNLSWCYLKTAKYQHAITTANKSYKLSKNEQYIDVSEQVLSSIGLFYVMAKKEKEGLQFYLANTKEPAKYIIKMSKKLANEGEFKKSEYLLNTSLKNAEENNLINERISIQLAKLELYRNFKKHALFFETTKSIHQPLLSKKTNKELKEDAINKIESMVGYHQLRLTRNSQKNITNYSQQLLKTILTYFDILIDINSSKTVEYRYFQAETLFAVNKIKQSYSKYTLALEKIKSLKRSSSEYTKYKESHGKKVLNSMLACLEYNRLSLKDKQYTFKNHIQLFPKDEVSRKIYPKYFNINLKKRSFKTAVGIINYYKRHFPQDISIQQAMFTTLMDKHIKEKNSDRMAYWIRKMEKGYLSFSLDYIKQATQILGNILFIENKNLSEKGEVNKAISNNINLFQNTKYPKVIRMQTGVRVAKDYLKNGETKNSSHWLENAYTLMNDKEKGNAYNLYFTFIDEIMSRQDFKTAANLSTKAIKKFCHDKDKNRIKDLINYRLISNLTLERFKQSYFEVKKTQTCHNDLDFMNKKILGILDYAHNFNKLHVTEYIFKKEKQNKTLKDRIGHNLYQHFITNYLQKSQTNQFKNIKSYRVLDTFSSLYPNSSVSKNYKKILSYSKLISKNKGFRYKYFNFKKTDPIEKLNSIIENKIISNNQIIATISSYLKNSPPEIVIDALRIIHQRQLNLAKNLKSLRPHINDSNFQVSFKKAMTSLSQNIKNNTDQEIAKAKKIISSNLIFSSNAQYFHSYNNTLRGIILTIPTDTMAYTFDAIPPMRSLASKARGKTK